MVVALDYQTWFKWIISIKVVFFVGFSWIYLMIMTSHDKKRSNMFEPLRWFSIKVATKSWGICWWFIFFWGGKSSTVWVYLWVYSTIPRFLLVGEEADFQLKGIMRIQANQQTTQVLNVPHFGIIPGWTPSQNSVDNNYSWEAYWNWGKTTIRLPIKLGKRILRFWISNVLIGDIACLGGTWGTDNKHVLFRYFKYHICCSSAANQCTLFSIIHGGLPTLESPKHMTNMGTGKWNTHGTM